MSSTRSVRRLLGAVGESPAAERIANAQATFYAPAIEWARRSPLHSDVLGHSLHPMLTDVTLGCWLSASVLDMVGGDGARAGATLLVGAGTLAAVPTAIAGAADWADASGGDRRIGAVHALGADVATFLFLGSLVARRSGRHTTGTALALAGNVVITGAGLLGGHLALSRGLARRSGAGAQGASS